MKPKVLFIVPGLGLGGAERWVVDLCRHLQAFDIAGVWPIARTCHADIVADLRKLGVWLIVPGERIEADVILAWGVPDPRKLVGPTNRPLVVVSHGVWPEAPDDYFERQAWQATHVTAVSEAAAQAFGPRYARCVTVLYNGADRARLELQYPPGHYREAWGIGPDERVVAHIGRLDPEKRPDRLLAAARHLPPEWAVVCVGDGKLRDECIKQAQATGRKVIFQYPVPHVGDIYNAVDAVCIGSAREGMPMVMPEAWLARVPVVTTNTPVALEMVRRHGKILSVLSQEHEPADMAAAIVAAATDTEMVERAAEVAAAAYTVERMAARWDEYLLQVIGGK